MPIARPRFPDERMLKRQAKALLRAVRANDHGARQRFLAHGRQGEPQTAQLAQAQFIIAREHGFASWPKLKAHLLAQQIAGQRRHEREAARLTRKLAREQVTAERATILLDNARAGASEQMATLFSRLPRREIGALRAALLARGEEEYSAVIAALIAGLRHSSSRVRYECAGALDHFGDDRAEAALRALLDDPVPRVRRMALHALSCEVCKLAPSPAEPDLIAHLVRHALHDTSVNVRRHAVSALVNRRDVPQAAAALDQLWREERDPVIQRMVRRAIGAGTDSPIRATRNAE